MKKKKVMRFRMLSNLKDDFLSDKNLLATLQNIHGQEKTNPTNSGEFKDPDELLDILCVYYDNISEEEIILLALNNLYKQKTEQLMMMDEIGNWWLDKIWSEE